MYGGVTFLVGCVDFIIYLFKLSLGDIMSYEARMIEWREEEDLG